MGKVNPILKRAKRYQKTHPKQFYFVSFAILLAIIVPLAAYFSLFSIRPPSAGNTGYAYFELVDFESREKVDGTIMLIDYNDTNTRYTTEKQEGFTNPIKTGKTVYIENPVIAYIYSVSLKSATYRRFLPVSISPMCSNDPTKPRLNSIYVYFYVDTGRITADIIKLDGSAGHFDEDNFKLDIQHSLTLNIKVNPRTKYSLYGHSSFVPDYRLPAKSEAEGITGYGLWLVFEGCQVTQATVENMDEAEFFYISSDDTSIILLNSIPGEGMKQDLSLKLNGHPSDIYVSQGFYEERLSTKIDIEA